MRFKCLAAINAVTIVEILLNYFSYTFIIVILRTHSDTQTRPITMMATQPVDSRSDPESSSSSSLPFAMLHSRTLNAAAAAAAAATLFALETCVRCLRAHFAELSH